jgi:Tol biopolymer transport system component
MIRRLLLLAACATGLVATAGSPAAAVALPADTTVVLSGAPDLMTLLPWPAGLAVSTTHALSRSGAFVVFESRSDGLLAGDDDDVVNVYVKDVTTGVTELASVDTSGAPSHANCEAPVISSNGAHVAFVCDAPLDPADTNGVEDVYLRDLDTQRTVLISRVLGGAVGNGPSKAPAIDAQGTFVAFTSKATNLGGPADGTQRVFRRAVGGGLDLVNVTDGTGAAGLLPGSGPSISADGRRVAFDTFEPLAGGDADAARDVYVRDFTQSPARTLLASVPATGGDGSQSSQDPVISGNGSTVAFTSASRLVPADMNDVDDVYTRNLSTGTTRLESAAGATTGDNNSAVAAISDDGAAVAFSSGATNLGGDAATVGYLNRGGTLVRVESTLAPPGGEFGDLALSGDATAIAFRTNGAIELQRAGAVQDVSRPPAGVPFENQGGADDGSVSADGRYVAFTTTWAGFGAPAGSQAVVVRDLETGALTVASRADGPQGAQLGDATHFPGGVAISADGRRVAFVLGDNNGPAQIYVRDIPAGRTFLVSAAPDGAAGDGAGRSPSISGDGRRVAFLSLAANLSPADGARDGVADVYVHDVDAGTTTLVDVANGTGAKAADGASGPAISGDGRSVAFETTDKLAADDTDVAPLVDDVYVRDLDRATTTLVSVDGAGHKGDNVSRVPSISGDGTRVSFLSNATNLGAGAVANGLYVRDLTARTLTLVGRADGPGGAVLDDAIVQAQLSADGQHVAFSARDPAVAIAPGAPADAVVRVYERDLASGVTRLVSRRPGPAGEALRAPGFAFPGGITADGGCVAFLARDLPLDSPARAEGTNLFLRTVTPNCGRPVPPPPPGGSSGGSRPVVLSRLALRPARFHVGGRRAGTRIHFRLDGSANVAFTVERLLPGRRAHGRCSARAHRGRRCTVVRRVGRLPVALGRAGANAVRFSGRVGARALAPGRYRLTATPAGGRSRTAGFVVVKAPRRIHHGTKGSR